MFPLIKHPGGGVAHPWGHLLDTFGVFVALGRVGCCVGRPVVVGRIAVGGTLVLGEVALICFVGGAGVVGSDVGVSVGTFVFDGDSHGTAIASCSLLIC